MSLLSLNLFNAKSVSQVSMFCDKLEKEFSFDVHKIEKGTLILFLEKPLCVTVNLKTGKTKIEDRPEIFMKPLKESEQAYIITGVMHEGMKKLLVEIKNSTILRKNILETV